MKKVVDIVTRAVSSRGGQMAAFAAMYVLLAVEYYRFVYVNYYYLMGFDFRLEPVAVVAGFFMLAVAMAAMFLLPGEEKGSYALSMLVALLLCLPSTVMYQFGGVSVFVPLYALLFLLLLRTPLLDMGRWRLPRLPVRYQRYLLPALCLLCLLPFPLAYGLEGIDLSLLTMGEETYDVRAAVSERDTLLTAYLMGPLRMVLLPMLIVYGLTDLKRNWWMSLLGVGGLLFLFLLNPQKSIFFGIAVVLAMYLFKSYRAKAGMILYGLAAACLAAALLNVATGHLMAESIPLLRRAPDAAVAQRAGPLGGLPVPAGAVAHDRRDDVQPGRDQLQHGHCRRRVHELRPRGRCVVRGCCRTVCEVRRRTDAECALLRPGGIAGVYVPQQCTADHTADARRPGAVGGGVFPYT